MICKFEEQTCCIFNVIIININQTSREQEHYNVIPSFHVEIIKTNAFQNLRKTSKWEALQWVESEIALVSLPCFTPSWMKRRGWGLELNIFHFKSLGYILKGHSDSTETNLSYPTLTFNFLKPFDSCLSWEYDKCAKLKPCQKNFCTSKDKISVKRQPTE